MQYSKQTLKNSKRSLFWTKSVCFCLYIPEFMMLSLHQQSFHTPMRWISSNCTTWILWVSPGTPSWLEKVSKVSAIVRKVSSLPVLWAGINTDTERVSVWAFHPTFRVVCSLQSILLHPGLALLGGAAQPGAVLTVAPVVMLIPAGHWVFWGHTVPHDLCPFWFQSNGLLQQGQVSLGHVKGLVWVVGGYGCGVLIPVLAGWVTSGGGAQLFFKLH